MKRDFFFFFKQQKCYESWWNVLITQPDFTCSECKQVQSTRRAVTRNSFSSEGQAAPTPKWWSFLAPPSPGLYLPAQHSLRGGGNRSRPAPRGRSFTNTLLLQVPCLPSNLIPWWVSSHFLAPTSVRPDLNTGRVCLTPLMLKSGKITEAGLGEPHLCSYQCILCSAHTTA